MADSNSRRRFLAASGTAALASTLFAERCYAGVPVWHQEETQVERAVPSDEDLAKLTDDKVKFIDRLLNVIEEEIVPRTDAGVHQT